MTLLAFMLGLLVSLGFWWRYIQLQRKLEHLLQTFQNDESKVSLPLIPRLRRQFVLQNQNYAQLQDQLQDWQYLLEVAPCGYLQVDAENQLLWCNKQAGQILGLQRWEPGQLRLLLELVRSYELDQLIEQTRERQQPEVREWVFHPACTDVAAMVDLPITLRASSWPLAKGQVGVFLENQQPLIELSQTRDRWVSDLAHELRTPLTSIRLVVEALQDQLQPPLRRWVDRLVPEVDRLITLVQGWLELSQLEANPHKQLNCQPVEVRTLIFSVWQSLDPLAQLYQLRLIYSGPETVWIKADRFQLYRVFVNLLDNSIKYSPAQGTISITVNLLPNESVPQQVQINIIDSGPGFPKVDLPHVFERLYRGDTARSRQPTSSIPTTTASGLGLAIVRQIVLTHGGSVKAMNDPNSGGAWLQLELPDVITDFRN